jgi:hypothetical protein
VTFAGSQKIFFDPFNHTRCSSLISKVELSQCPDLAKPFGETLAVQINFQVQ